jgi:hypothetical protein
MLRETSITLLGIFGSHSHLHIQFQRHSSLIMCSARRAGSPQCSPRFWALLQHCLFLYVYVYGAAKAFYVAICLISMLRSAIDLLFNFVYSFSSFNSEFSTPFYFLAILLLLGNQCAPYVCLDPSNELPKGRSRQSSQWKCSDRLRDTSFARHQAYWAPFDIAFERPDEPLARAMIERGYNSSDVDWNPAFLDGRCSK